MKKALNEDYTVNPDIEFWREAEYFVQDKTRAGNDIYGASSGHHDDIIMADMIARYVCDSMMVEQGYTIRDELVDNGKGEIGGIFLEKKTWLSGLGKNKKQNSFVKEAFRNNA